MFHCTLVPNGMLEHGVHCVTNLQDIVQACTGELATLLFLHTKRCGSFAPPLSRFICSLSSSTHVQNNSKASPERHSQTRR